MTSETGNNSFKKCFIKTMSKTPISTNDDAVLTNVFHTNRYLQACSNKRIKNSRWNSAVKPLRRKNCDAWRSCEDNVKRSVTNTHCNVFRCTRLGFLRLIKSVILLPQNVKQVGGHHRNAHRSNHRTYHTCSFWSSCDSWRTRST